MPGFLWRILLLGCKVSLILVSCSGSSPIIYQWESALKCSPVHTARRTAWIGPIYQGGPVEFVPASYYCGQLI